MYRQHTHLSSSFSLSPLPTLTCHFRHFSACACMRGGGEGTKGKKGCPPRTGRVRTRPHQCYRSAASRALGRPYQRRRDVTQRGATRAKDSRRACSGGRHSAAPHSRTTLGCPTLCHDTLLPHTVAPHTAAPHSATTLGCTTLCHHTLPPHTLRRHSAARHSATTPCCPTLSHDTLPLHTLRPHSAALYSHHVAPVRTRLSQLPKPSACLPLRQRRDCFQHGATGGKPCRQHPMRQAVMATQQKRIDKWFPPRDLRRRPRWE